MCADLFIMSYFTMKFILEVLLCPSLATCTVSECYKEINMLLYS